MLNDYLAEYNAEKSTSYDAREIVAKLIETLHTGSYLTKTATAHELERVRITMLDILELFERGETESAINGINNILI